MSGKLILFSLNVHIRARVSSQSCHVNNSHFTTKTIKNIRNVSILKFKGQGQIQFYIHASSQPATQLQGVNYHLIFFKRLTEKMVQNKSFLEECQSILATPSLTFDPLNEKTPFTQMC